MQFRKVTASKYIGSNGYSLRRMRNGRFSICLGRSITNWGTGFPTVKSAENFINRHDYIHATSDHIGLSADDIEFIVNMYGFEPTDKEGLFEREGGHFIRIGEENGILYVTIGHRRAPEKANRKFDNADELLSYLDTLFPEDNIFASVIYRGIEFRSILASKKRQTSRELTQNLVRVKSSNVWAYGVEIKDNNAKVGDVYIQFKGKNGGPGDVYKYYDVPVNTWRRILSHPSKGHAVWKYLRNSFYYSKLTGDKRGKLPNAIN